jgi:hypothetical protein
MVVLAFCRGLTFFYEICSLASGISSATAIRQCVGKAISNIYCVDDDNVPVVMFVATSRRFRPIGPRCQEQQGDVG